MKRISLVSKNYANAFIDSFGDDFMVGMSQLGQVNDSVLSSDDLKIIMDNPSISVDSKNKIIEDLFGNKVDIRVINLLKLLISKQRFNLVNEIYSSCQIIVNEKNNKKNVEIISAIELDDEKRKEITSIVESKLNCQIVPEWNIDKSIIAGLIFKYDDYVIDTSVRSRLSNISTNMMR